MENADVDLLLGGQDSGDRAAGAETNVSGLPGLMKREQDSTDDFEHLDKERQEAGESPMHQPRAATQNFLDMERAPSASDRFIDQLADKFTDSESDADTTGESPLHRAQPAPLPAPLPEPSLLPPLDPTPVLAPASAPVPDFVPLKPEPILHPGAEFIRDLELEHSKIQEPVVQQPAEPTPTLKPAPKAKEPTAPAPALAAAPSRAPVAHVIEAEVIFCQMGLDAWFDPQRLHPEVEAVIYWRDAARSGLALGAGLALLVALACCSVVSVLAYGSLLALSAAVAFRVYKNVLQAVQKTNEGHPFKWLLETDISVPAERAQALAAAGTAHLNAAASELRRLFLVEDLVDSLKFGVLLWCLTYVGACFNGITLIILGWIALFTLPKAYEMNKPQVDANLELARAKINEITAKVRAAVPLGRKAETDKEK